jgi:TnpA family transposase
MPVEFLTHEQEVKYGKFSEDPSPEQLAKYFWFDDKDKNAIFNHRHDYNRLGFALQLGTVRFLGTFLTTPIEVPANVISYVSQQLKIKPEVASFYNSEKNTQNHRNEIRQIYEYHDFTSHPFHFRLIRWLYSRAWIYAERPSVMFDLATARCVESKILLPGVTTLARLIAQVRDRASIRLRNKLGKLPSNDQLILLENLLGTESGNRNTLLDILRQPPTTATPKGLLIAIDRLERLRLLGALEWNLSGIPVGRLRVLSRYASMARAQTIERMNYERRIATLVSFGRAIGELGRIYKTKHNLTYIDDEAFRRKILTQLNRGESRHSLARAVWYGKKGELNQNYREGQEDQLGALGLIVNAIVIWNTRYMESALEVIRNRGNILEYEDVPRLSPLGYEHINIVGKYSFNLSETVANGKLRPLINIEEIPPQQED